MKKVTPKVCSMALLMHCRLTGHELTCTWAEMSNSSDNYRGELLGALYCSLILKTATAAPAAYSPRKLLQHCEAQADISVSSAPSTTISLSPSNTNGWRVILMILEKDTSNILISTVIMIG
jgi:hypothetical protein